MLTAAAPPPKLLPRPTLLCAGSGIADVGVTLSDPFAVSALGIAASGLLGETLVGVTTRFSFITCCDCLSFLSSISFVSSLRKSCRNLRKLFSRSLSSACVNSLMGTYGGISSSSVSESMFPFCCLPFVRAGSRTISGASAYDLGSVRGRSTRRCTLFSSWALLLTPLPLPLPLPLPAAAPAPVNAPPSLLAVLLLVLFVLLLLLFVLLLLLLLVLLLLELVRLPLPFPVEAFVGGAGAGVMVNPVLLAVSARRSRLLSARDVGVIVNAGSRPLLRLKSTTSSTSILAIFARRVVVMSSLSDAVNGREEVENKLGLVQMNTTAINRLQGQ